MIEIKLFKYDKDSNGYRGEDLSKYVLQGTENIEKLNSEMDLTNITLKGYNQKEEFVPETRFIVDEYQDGVLQRTFDRVVQEDVVNKPILSDDNYYIHNITFTEPSVSAQKRLVDNIAITYKLKDVNLETRLTYDLNRKMVFGGQNRFNGTKYFSKFKPDTDGYICRFGKYIKWSDYTDEDAGAIFTFGSSFNFNTSYYRNIEDFEDDEGNYKARFTLPVPRIYVGRYDGAGNTFYQLGLASFDYKIIEKDKDGNPTGNEITGSKISNDNLNSLFTIYPYQDEIFGEHIISNTELQSRWLLERVSKNDTNGNDRTKYRTTSNFIWYFRKYTDSNGIDLKQLSNRLTELITLHDNCSYTIEVSLHQFSDNIPSGLDYYVEKDAFPFPSNYTVLLSKSFIVPTSQVNPIRYYGEGGSNVLMNINNAQRNTSVFVYKEDTVQQVLGSGNPYSAWFLLQKAIINSGNYEKVSDIPSNEINAQDNDNNYKYNCPFYIDPNFELELRQTQVNETFFSQKNLWEILLEIGNYIHAIPEIKFGESDKLMITFNRLGESNEKEDKGEKMTITNFRGVDDYISSCSSYITNMVQLGGQIEEEVAPKTTSESFLTYNDNVEIICSKPIIELLKIEVVCNSDNYNGESGKPSIEKNAVADMTEYVYEKNVYEILGVQYNVEPNKGFALYYELGNNKIKGGQYQLPQKNTNMYSDYTIKKVIWCAFHGGTPEPPETPPVSYEWSKINVNDFTFRLIYRTKDDVRQEQTRPDIRKYLLTNKWDTVPQHNQFNNQEDVLVDSQLFGQNMFGKLIKTGNSNYMTTEWVDNVNKLKHKGEVYRINGDLYYVAVITNQYFCDHIISEIEYSKDFNQLSQVIGIPSEPRFYEISEQSLIRRDKAISDYLLITDNDNDLEVNSDNEYKQSYILNLSHLKDLVLFGQVTYAKYVISVFKGDADIVGDDEKGTFGEPDTYIEVMSPINAYSSGNTLTYEWDMVDNLSAGDKVGDVSFTKGETADNAYRALRAVQYTDKYGKATLLDFYILEDLEQLTGGKSYVYNLPSSPINTLPTNANDGRPLITGESVLVSNVKVPYTSGGNPHKNGLIMFKDCREAMSFDYNLQVITSSDTFITSPFVFSLSPIKSENAYIVLLSEETNKLSNGYINNSAIITPFNTQGSQVSSPLFDISGNVNITNGTDGWGNTVCEKFEINLQSLLANINADHFGESETTKTKVKSIALITNVSISNNSIVGYNSRFIFARNIPSNWNKANAIKNWKFGNPKKSQLFKKYS